MFDELRKKAVIASKLNINTVAKQILSSPEFKDFILKLQLEDQLFEGINSLGVTVGNYGFGQEAVTFKGKTKQKNFNDPYVFFDTGTFYDSFKVDVTKDDFTIDSDPVKEDGTNLLVKFGKELEGLTDEHLQLLINKITDALRIFTNRQLTA